MKKLADLNHKKIARILFGILLLSVIFITPLEAQTKSPIPASLSDLTIVNASNDEVIETGDEFTVLDIPENFFYFSLKSLSDCIAKSCDMTLKGVDAFTGLLFKPFNRSEKVKQSSY